MTRKYTPQLYHGDITEPTITTVSNVCDQKTQGIALLAGDKEVSSLLDLWEYVGSIYMSVCLVIVSNAEEILRQILGNSSLKKFSLNKVKTPVLIKTDECLSVHCEKDETVLCFFNKYSRDNWWMAITKQILCNNQGKARNEVYGEASLEEVQMDVESLNKKDQKKGINIHIDGGEASNFPQVKVHYRE
ncbi:hypothetical protein X943_001650 [Babesia divergens]|uniref:Uncharacterized protein n=1 Tax=Babesia divergens TaxID=32595 RepID=A0AAD9GEG9_BABDI|nr:hypothetical protein X943_001650 [Babesia divergens]